MVWGGGNDKVKLHKSDAAWNMCLHGAEGLTLRPGDMPAMKCSR